MQITCRTRTLTQPWWYWIHNVSSVFPVQCIIWLFICVYSENCSFVWSMTESERGCAAGNCFLFTLKSRSRKLYNQPEKVASWLYLSTHVCVCVWKRESETHTEKAGHLWGNASQGFLCASGFVLEGYGTLRGWDKQTAGPVVERTNSDPKSKRVKNVHTLRLNTVWWSFHVIWRAGVKPCSLLYTLPCLHHADLALRQNDSEADCQHTNGSCVLLLNSSKRQLSITPPSLM